METTNGCIICGRREFQHLYDINQFAIVKCVSCEFVCCHPTPSQAELERHYSKPHLYLDQPYVAHTNFGRRLKYTLLVKLLKLFLPRTQKIKLLEIGCSQGDLLTVAAKDGRYAATGLDYEKGPVAYARSVGLDARLGDVESAQFAPGSFDVVVAIHVVEHLQNPLATFSEIHRILRPGGLFFGVTPCITHIKSRLAGRHWKYLGPPDHLWYFSPKTITAFGQKLGFNAIHASCWYHRAHLRFLLRKTESSTAAQPIR